MADEERPMLRRTRAYGVLLPLVLVLVLALATAGCGVDTDLVAPDVRTDGPAWSDPSAAIPPTTSRPATQPPSSEPDAAPVPVPGTPAGATWLGPMRTMGDLVVAPSEEGVVAFRPASGETVWTAETCSHPNWASHISNPDTAVAVFACDRSHTGIDPASGRVLWRRERASGVDRTRVAGGLLLTASPQEIVAVDLVTGVESWRRTGFGDTTPTADADRYYLANDAGVTAFDKATGAVLWSLADPTSDIWAGRAAVYVRTSDHRLIKVDGASGTVIWTSLVEGSRLDWSVVVGEGDRAVVLQTARDTDRFTAYDSETGEQTWIHDPPEGSAAIASVLGGEFVVTYLDAGGVVVMDAPSGRVRCELPDAVDVAVLSNGQAVVIAIVDGRQAFSIEHLTCA